MHLKSDQDTIIQDNTPNFYFDNNQHIKNSEIILMSILALMSILTSILTKYSFNHF